MIKKFKPAILVLAHILLLQGICGQVPMNMTDYLSKKFSNYTTSVPREEIYVHSDRDEYISGEVMWFNLYLIDRKSLKASPESKIAYFELLNAENRPIVQKRILLDDGFGPGQIVLPDTLSTGIYTIRAYTSWMKNFFPFNCFTKNINIYNAFSLKTIKKTIISDKTFTTDERTRNYPTAIKGGLHLKVDNLKPDVLEIDVVTDENYRAENNNLFYLFIQTRGNINRASMQGITDEHTKISIPKKQLPAGINQITVFNLKGQPVDERFIYTPDKENPAVTINSADSAGLRNKISLDLAFGNGESAVLNPANISISVAPSVNNHTVMDLNDYLVFGTEFGVLNTGALKNVRLNMVAPEFIDSLLQTVRSNWIDWNAILSDEPPVLRYPAEKEDHFISGKLLNSDKKSEAADNFVLLSRPGKKAVFQYAKTDKEGNFSFRIHIDEKINDLIIQPDIIAKNQSLNIQSPFSDQYLKTGKSADSTNKTIPDYISAWSVNQQVRKIYGITSIGDTLNRMISVTKAKRFYGKPDQELNMKDYITLPVMQEVFFELLVGVFLKNKKAGYEITISDPEINKPYDTPPGLFIDGVKVKDPSAIAGLDPEIVEKIDVVREKYFVGDYLFYGIVNIITKAGDFSNATLPDYALRMSYRVIDPVFSFVSPDYSSIAMKKNRIPDFRNTLYWNPSLKPDKEGKAKLEFWTSDFVSDFEVNIQGFAPDGKIFTIRKIIKVRR
jgi:hypothetical protein